MSLHMCMTRIGFSHDPNEEELPPTFTIGVRTGFNWRTYPVELPPDLHLRSDDFNQRIRITQIDDNHPVAVEINGMWVQLTPVSMSSHPTVAVPT